jgi:hypothetical protein
VKEDSLRNRPRGFAPQEPYLFSPPVSPTLTKAIFIDRLVFFLLSLVHPYFSSKMNRKKTNQKNWATQQSTNNAKRPDILFNCPFLGRPGNIVRTNCGLYQYQYVTIPTGTVSKRELLPVYDRTAPANIIREQRNSRHSFPQGCQSSPKHEELTFTHLANSAIRKSLTLKEDNEKRVKIIESLNKRIDMLRNLNIEQYHVLKYFRNKSIDLQKQNKYNSKLLQQAKKVNLSQLVDGKLAKDRIEKEITELNTQNSALHVKIGKLNENHAHTLNQFVDSIVLLSKLRNENNLIKIGRKCMTKFDNICHISPTSAGQDISTPDSQLVRTDDILSRASTTCYYVFNQMRRILGIVAGLQLMDPDQ